MGVRHVKKEDQESKGKGAAEEDRVRRLYKEFKELSWWIESRLQADAKTPRVTGTISLFQQDGGVKVCIRDRTEARVAFVWGRGLIEALDAAEEGLAAGSLDWRRDRFAQET